MSCSTIDEDADAAVLNLIRERSLRRSHIYVDQDCGGGGANFEEQTMTIGEKWQQSGRKWKWKSRIKTRSSPAKKDGGGAGGGAKMQQDLIRAIKRNRNQNQNQNQAEVERRVSLRLAYPRHH